MTRILSCAAAALLLSASPARAQAGGLEDQLRARLRDVSAQLAQAQADAAPMKARLVAAEKERDAAKAQLGKARPAAAGPSAAERARIAGLENQLAVSRRAAASTTAGVKAANDLANANAIKSNAAIAELKAERDTARQALAVYATAGQRVASTLAAAQVKNARLYALARQILDRYERVGFGDVLISREPFVGKARVRLENDAETLGGKIYDCKVDVRSDALNAATAATTAK